MAMWNGDMRTIPDNCQKLLAQMLHDMVDCKLDPRSDCDWETAGALLNKHQELINVAVHQLTFCTWFAFRADFSMQTTVVDSGAFHEICWHAFWENLRHWARELPSDKYGTGRGFG